MINLRISTIGTIISVFLALSAAAIVSSSISTSHQVRQAGGAWHSFETGPSRKSSYLNTVYKALGFGGMLHQYKDYMLGQDRKQIVQFHIKIREIRTALDAYNAIGVNAAEKQALEDILRVIQTYSASLQQVEQMVKQGKRSDEIARAIVIDDTPAIHGIDALLAEIDKSRDDSARVVNSAVTQASFLSETSSIVVGIILVALLAAMIWFTRWRLGRPLMMLSEAMCRLAKGETDVDVPSLEMNDEIGEMARTVQVFRQNAIAMKEMEDEREEQERQAEEDKRHMLHTMADELESNVKTAIESVTENAGQIVTTAEGMGTKMDSTTSRSLEVAEASSRTSENVQTVAASTEQLSGSIQEISKQVAHSSTKASEAVTEAERANDKVQSLDDAAKKIGEVVALITDIADQTNLLALNATIEAARAGEAGKGFAVVASEVKNLANQTAKATEDISTQISGIQDATFDAVHAIEGISGTIGEINSIASTIAAAVEEQGAATQEIARSVRDVTTDAQTVSSSIVNVTRSTASSYGSAIRVLWRARDLNGPVEVVNLEVNKFLNNIRST